MGLAGSIAVRRRRDAGHSIMAQDAAWHSHVVTAAAQLAAIEAKQVVVAESAKHLQSLRRHQLPDRRAELICSLAAAKRSRPNQPELSGYQSIM